MTVETNTPSYWLNWRFLVCAVCVLMSMVLAAFLIWKYEGFNKSKPERRENRQNQQESVGSVYEDEAWGTCLKGIHPAWLLAYRLIAFITLLTLLTINVALDSFGIFFFYTQWTFALVTFYFGVCHVLFGLFSFYAPTNEKVQAFLSRLMNNFAFSYSVYGCWKRKHRADGSINAEQGNYVAPTPGQSLEESYTSKRSTYHDDSNDRQAAGVCGYLFQIIFQISAGAVVLTDSVFWLLLYPFLTSRALNFLLVCMHSINATFLLGETILNSLRFPMFRIGYFLLWTSVFVIFQWIIHVCVSLRWPYPFLDLSSPFAPLWYIGVGVMHIPCYGIFALIIRMKHSHLAGSRCWSCPR